MVHSSLGPLRSKDFITCSKQIGKLFASRSVDLVEVAEGLAVIRDECQVDGQLLELLAQRVGGATRPARVELAARCGVVRRSGQERAAAVSSEGASRSRWQASDNEVILAAAASNKDQSAWAEVLRL